ncbi:hypothetical protein CQY20_29555 [Mycolicibacterium agri]|uniref:DUF3558 domain-containing protein n=1 Tax=Mycolicibacterium agri TaxID=36811 RepID=A0A2A7MPP3_MYCAG|nr:DUF3558 family protein [Mycolicibacterium agri]PEG33654.1 hypothetical protein CQY20_29555 [Mycolicibacterium agri]GFG54376.1 hypothetical protein MAGR_58170 [Mycolicibacterium agri]
MAPIRTAFAFVVLATGLTLTGCAGDTAEDAEPESQAESSQSSVETPGADAAIDACALIGGDDIAELLGQPVAGRPIGTPEAPACTWENRDTYESVTLEIGSPNTAANGTLAPPEPGFGEVGTPGPDGMRILASGMVEFPAGGRSNTVQVAVLSLLGPDADNAAVDLARKVTSQLPQ